MDPDVHIYFPGRVAPRWGNGHHVARWRPFANIAKSVVRCLIFMCD